MFGRKDQIIKYDPEQFMIGLNSEEPLCYRYDSKITDKNAYIETNGSAVAFLKIGSEFVRSYPQSDNKLFHSQDEIKLWQKGVSVNVYFIQADLTVKGNWLLNGSNLTQFRDPRTQMLVKFVQSFGTFEAKVDNQLKFVRTMVGSASVYRISNLQKYISDYISEIFHDVLFNSIKEEGILYEDLILWFSSLSKKMQKRLNEDLSEERGFTIVSFKISQETKVDFDESEKMIQGSNEKDRARSDFEYAKNVIAEEEEKEHKRKMEEETLYGNTSVQIAQAISNASTNEHHETPKVIYCPVCHEKNPVTQFRCVWCGAKLKE